MRPLMAAAKGSRRTTVFSLAGLAEKLNRFLSWDGPDVPIYVPVTQAGRFAVVDSMALGCE